MRTRAPTTLNEHISCHTFGTTFVFVYQTLLACGAPYGNAVKPCFSPRVKLLLLWCSFTWWRYHGGVKLLRVPAAGKQDSSRMSVGDMGDKAARAVPLPCHYRHSAERSPHRVGVSSYHFPGSIAVRCVVVGDEQTYFPEHHVYDLASLQRRTFVVTMACENGRITA